MKFTNALGGCANCGALTSPCWRKGPEDAKHLCNACGSRYLVKGTLEGYKPGLKSRAGSSKRGKSSKSKPFPGSSHSGSVDRHCSDSPQKRVRLFKEHSHHFTQYAEKGTQTMSPAELQAYFDNGSPKSPLDFKLDPHDSYLDANPSIQHDKDSSDESSPEAELLAAGGKVVRRRARKPFRPTVSTW